MTDVAPPVRRRLSDDAIEHLHSLMAGWQVIADLAFADLLLCLALEASESFRIAAQLRPYTARTLYPADLVGEVVLPTWHPYVERAWREGRRQRSVEPILIDAEPVRVETVPVRHQGEIVAVLSVESPETPARPTGRLEASYLGAAEALVEMVAGRALAGDGGGRGLPVRGGPGPDGVPPGRRRPGRARRQRPGRVRQPQRDLGLPAHGDQRPAARPAASPPGRP